MIQNIALKVGIGNESSLNWGNLEDLLSFRMESGYIVLKEHLFSSLKNVTYTSKYHVE